MAMQGTVSVGARVPGAESADTHKHRVQRNPDLVNVPSALGRKPAALSPPDLSPIDPSAP
jgi:hypothetical protein